MRTRTRMTDAMRRVVALCLCELMAFLPVSQSWAQTPATPAKPEPLRSYLQKSYLELFELAPSLHFSAEEIRKQRESFAKSEESCVNRFKDHVKRYQKQLDTIREDLKKNTKKMSSEQRKTAHCSIQSLDLLKSEAEILARQAVPTGYDNLNAKLDVIEKWPFLYQQTQQEIASEAYMKRRWADVKDIGFREIEANQQG